LNSRNMYCPPHGVHVPPVQRHSSPRGAMPQGARPQVVRPRGGCVRQGSGHDRDDFGPRSSGFGFYPLADHIFLVVIAFSPVDHIFPFVVIALLLGLG
jgi:hypothetical protein